MMLFSPVAFAEGLLASVTGQTTSKFDVFAKPVTETPRANTTTQPSVKTPPLIALEADVAFDYQRFLAGRDLRTIRDYSGPNSRRDVVEVMLFYQALAFGGYTEELGLFPGSTYRRIVQQVGAAKAVASGPLVWREDANEVDHFISEAIVKSGEFIVGLYTSPNNSQALQVRQAADLKGLSAVSSQHWRADWRALNALPVRNVYDTFLWSTMVRMVWADRADFTLAPFQPGPDMAISLDHLTLIPIPNVKLALSGSRHWIVSRRHPQGKKLFTALERGIAKLRQLGLIQKAYRQSGFYNERVDDWQLLNDNMEHRFSENPSQYSSMLSR